MPSVPLSARVPQTSAPGVSAPPLPLFLSELPRALLELAGSVASFAWPPVGAQGDGHAVLLLPGLLADDGYTAFARSWLRARGFDARPWRGGNNTGRWDALERIVLPAIERLADETGRPVSLVGASIGGVYARAAATRLPQQVRCVVTLASPVEGPHRANYVWPIYEVVSAQPAEEASAVEPPVPSTSIYSRFDGLTAWQPCLQRRGALTENIEVGSSHTGMMWNPMVLRILADRLSQPEGAWKPYDPSAASAGAATARPGGRAAAALPA